MRAYPTDSDVCNVIGESDLTRKFLDHTTILIGCPVSETAAIDDHLASGATQNDTIDGWVLLSVPSGGY